MNYADQISKVREELAYILVKLCLAIIIKESDQIVRDENSDLIDSVKNLYNNRENFISYQALAQDGSSIVKKFTIPNSPWDNSLDNMFDIFIGISMSNEAFYQQVRKLIEVIEKFPLSLIYTLEIKEEILKHLENLRTLARPVGYAWASALTSFNWETALTEKLIPFIRKSTRGKEQEDSQATSSFALAPKNVKQPRSLTNAILGEDHSREAEGTALISSRPSASNTNTNSTIQIQNNIELTMTSRRKIMELKKEFACLLLKLWAIVEKRNLPEIEVRSQFDSIGQGFFLFSSSSGSTIPCESKVLKELFIDLMNKIQTELNLSIQIEEINSIFNISTRDLIINTHFHEKAMKFIAVIEGFCTKRALDSNKFKEINNHLNIIQRLSYPHGSLALEEVFNSVVDQEFVPENSARLPGFENFKISSSATRAGPSNTAPRAGDIKAHRKENLVLHTDEVAINLYLDIEADLKNNGYRNTLSLASSQPLTSDFNTSESTEVKKSINVKEKIIEFQRELACLTLKLNRVVEGETIPKIIEATYNPNYPDIPVFSFATGPTNNQKLLILPLIALAEGGLFLIKPIKTRTTLFGIEEVFNNIFSIFTAKDFSMDESFNKQVIKFIRIIREFINNSENIASVEGKEEIEKHLQNLQKFFLSKLPSLETIWVCSKEVAPLPLPSPSTKLQVNSNSVNLKRSYASYAGPSNNAMESVEDPAYKRAK